MSKPRRHGNPAILVAILILLLVLIYSGLQILGPTVFNTGTNEDPPIQSKTIVRDGVSYFPRQDITVLMLLGIDQVGPVQASEYNSNEGNADMIALVIFDEVDESYSVLTLNRDTMTDIPIIGLGGKRAGSIYAQLTLSHTYGSGLEDSCENTRAAVSDLLGGINIDYYISMNMSAISMVNDAVGGVQVTVTDDFSQVDPDITKGEFVLHGEQARTFLQSRYDIGNQLNLSRMERHKEYMDGFVDALGKSLESSDSFVIDTYDAVADYIVTDCSVNTVSGMLNRYADYELKEIAAPEGENVRGDEYMEFYVDEEALDELVLRLFYAPKK